MICIFLPEVGLKPRYIALYLIEKGKLKHYSPFKNVRKPSTVVSLQEKKIYTKGVIMRKKALKCK